MKDEKDMKYYTPAIEEFHVGFECQVVQEGQWITVMPFESGTLAYVERSLNEDSCRVKYLDRDDIESFGFEFQELKWNKVSEERTFKSAKYTILFFGFYTTTVNTHLKGRLTIYSEQEDILFDGRVKNKSELKRILTQTGVI